MSNLMLTRWLMLTNEAPAAPFTRLSEQRRNRKEMHKSLTKESSNLPQLSRRSSSSTTCQHPSRKYHITSHFERSMEAGVHVNVQSVERSLWASSPALQALKLTPNAKATIFMKSFLCSSAHLKHFYTTHHTHIHTLMTEAAVWSDDPYQSYSE